MFQQGVQFISKPLRPRWLSDRGAFMHRKVGSRYVAEVLLSIG